MSNKGLKGKFIGNILYAFSAQLISLIVSLLLSLVVPKFLGVKDFAYWQLFIFYTNYVNIAQFGLIDGIYLRLGGKKYKDLDFSILKSQYIVFSIIQILICFFISALSVFIVKDASKILVFIGVGIYLFIYNSSRFFGFIFQAVNETKLFSITSMIDRIIVLLLGVILIFQNNIRWYYFMIIYITGIGISLIYSIYHGKEIFFEKNKQKLGIVIREMVLNCSIGLNLMISNLASNLIIGSGRQFIEWHWGIETFGRVSFSLSMTSFFLVFINQVSLVMFPALRQVSSEEGKIIFKKIEKGFSLISPIVYAIYIPASFILMKWLPQYKSSLEYLMILMPICVFDGKMQMLYNTFMKVYRKEKTLLMVNVICVFLSVLVSIISVFIFNSIYTLLIGLVIVIIFRSILSNNLLCNHLSLNKSKNIIIDVLFAISFILLTVFANKLIAEISIITLYLTYLYFNRDYLFGIIGEKNENNSSSSNEA